MSCRFSYNTIKKENNNSYSNLTINNKSITICGVNRHEHHPTKGKVQTLTDIINDLKLLKI